MQAKVAPVLAKWRNKLLAAALEAFQENVASAADKRQQVQRALCYWNNRALAGAFAQWLQTVEVGHSPAAERTRLQQHWGHFLVQIVHAHGAYLSVCFGPNQPQSTSAVAAGNDALLMH